jgi:exoribonuclease-2
MAGELKPGTLPAEFAPLLKALLYKPDRNRLETKALELACAESGLSAPRLLARCGACLPATITISTASSSNFPQGTGFRRLRRRPAGAGGPAAGRRAGVFHRRCGDDRDRRCLLGHAAGRRRLAHRHPHRRAGLGIRPDSALGASPAAACPRCTCPGARSPCCRRRWSSASRSAPARLPGAVALSRGGAGLRRARRVPASSGCRWWPTCATTTSSRSSTRQTLAEGGPEFAYKRELTLLWEFATVLEAGRGKPSANQQNTEYSFTSTGASRKGRIDIVRAAAARRSTSWWPS